MNIRKQIADTLRYVRRTHGYWVDREVYSEEIDRLRAPASMSDVMQVIKTHNLSIDDVMLEEITEYDFDDYAYSFLTISVINPQNDESYFESLCETVLPTPYQLEEYDTYKRLKFKYEGIYL